MHSLFIHFFFFSTGMCKLQPTKSKGKLPLNQHNCQRSWNSPKYNLLIRNLGWPFTIYVITNSIWYCQLCCTCIYGTVNSVLHLILVHILPLIYHVSFKYNVTWPHNILNRWHWRFICYVCCCFCVLSWEGYLWCIPWSEWSSRKLVQYVPRFGTTTFWPKCNSSCSSWKPSWLSSSSYC